MYIHSTPEHSRLSRRDEKFGSNVVTMVVGKAKSSLITTLTCLGGNCPHNIDLRTCCSVVMSATSPSKWSILKVYPRNISETKVGFLDPSEQILTYRTQWVQRSSLTKYILQWRPRSGGEGCKSSRCCRSRSSYQRSIRHDSPRILSISERD
jgi:hypothetical protein